MRALLDLMRGNEAAVQDISTHCKTMLQEASVNLKILDPEHGEHELIKSVAAEMTQLSLPLRQAGALVLCITHKGPYVGVSRPRSWSHLPVLGAIPWAFISKS
jgi:hypothetical protein